MPELFCSGHHATEICGITFLYFYCRNLFKAPAAAVTFGRSNFLRNKSHIVGRSFPSINTSSLSFLPLLHCSQHQSHPIRCLVTVPLLKTDSRLPLPLNSTSQMRLCRQKHDVRSPEPPPDLSAVSALPRRQGLSDVPFRQIFVACYSIRKSRRWQTGKKCQINTNKREKNNAQMQITAGWLEMK